MNLKTPSEVSRISLYIKIATILRGKILSGDWKRGERMPTINELSDQYDVSRITIQKALDLLVTDGLVTSTRGRGTFVSETYRSHTVNEGIRAAINDRLDLSSDDSIQILSRKQIKAIPDEFRPIEDNSQRFMQIRKLHLHRGEPFSLIDCIVDLDLYKTFPSGSDRNTKLLKLIHESGVRLKFNRQEMTITYADFALAETLRCSVAAALVRVRSWRRDLNDKLVFAAATLYRGDHFLYDIVEGDSTLEQSRALIIPKSKR